MSIQLDESTDVDNCCQLLAYVRYVKENDIFEEFLFCESLELTTKGIDVYNNVKDFFSKNKIPMSVIGSICTNGASSLIGNNSGFIAYMKKELPEVITTHCVVHRHALASKTLPDKFKKPLTTPKNVVNYIRGRSLNHRIFRTSYEEIGTGHVTLRYSTKIRWLPKGQMLSRVFGCLRKLFSFLLTETPSYLKILNKEI